MDDDTDGEDHRTLGAAGIRDEPLAKWINKQIHFFHLKRAEKDARASRYSNRGADAGAVLEPNLYGANDVALEDGAIGDANKLSVERSQPKILSDGLRDDEHRRARIDQGVDFHAANPGQRHVSFFREDFVALVGKLNRDSEGAHNASLTQTQTARSRCNSLHGATNDIGGYRAVHVGLAETAEQDPLDGA